MVYVHFAEGFEEVEAVTIVDLLRRAAIDVKMVSIMEDKMVEGAHGMQIQADLLFEEADYDDCDMIVLPGGMPGALHLKKNPEGWEKGSLKFALQGKALAAICAAPMVLDARGALTHKTATIYPGMQNELNIAWSVDSGVVEDGDVITGKGPAYAIGFALAIIRKIKGDNAADEVVEGLLYKGILSGEKIGEFGRFFHIHTKFSDGPLLRRRSWMLQKLLDIIRSPSQIMMGSMDCRRLWEGER